VNADLQLAEIPLFTLNKILLPGSELPLQVDKENFGGKEMIDRSSPGGVGGCVCLGSWGGGVCVCLGNQGYFKGYVLPLLFFFFVVLFIVNNCISARYVSWYSDSNSK
jgi:hypothetical protein